MTSNYPSRYSPNKNVTAAQYILELICEKKAKTQQKDLPIKFWNLPEWKKYFKTQLRKCHSLLKKYDERAIISALKDRRAKKIFSLHAPWLDDIIKEHDNKIKLERTKEKIVRTSSKSASFRKNTFVAKKNIISKLRDLDDD